MAARTAAGNGQLQKKILEWIEELPERQREAFELSRYEGLFHQEIAGVMQVSVKTVNNHLTSALKTLAIPLRFAPQCFTGTTMTDELQKQKLQTACLPRPGAPARGG
jgi:DNA-binding NarL/FixJ family response regulator